MLCPYRGDWQRCEPFHSLQASDRRQMQGARKPPVMERLRRAAGARRAAGSQASRASAAPPITDSRQAVRVTTHFGRRNRCRPAGSRWRHQAVVNDTSGNESAKMKVDPVDASTTVLRYTPTDGLRYTRMEIRTSDRPSNGQIARPTAFGRTGRAVRSTRSNGATTSSAAGPRHAKTSRRESGLSIPNGPTGCLRRRFEGRSKRINR